MAEIFLARCPFTARHQPRLSSGFQTDRKKRGQRFLFFVIGGKAQKVQNDRQLETTLGASYENGELEPPLPVLLYAEAAGVCTDVLIDDRQHLPKELPATPKHKP